MEIRSLAGGAPEVRDATDTAPAGIKGYGYKWGDVYEFNSWSGVVHERIERGAFKDSLKRADVKLMIGHNRESLPLARADTGTFRVVEDEVGLRFDADLDESDPEAMSLLRKVRSGLADKMSIGFSMRDGGIEKVITPKEKGAPTELVIERVGELMEISVVSWPAYSKTELSPRMRDLLGDRDGAAPEPEPAGVRVALAEQVAPPVAAAEPDPEPKATPADVAAAVARFNVRRCGILGKELARHVNGDNDDNAD